LIGWLFICLTLETARLTNPLAVSCGLGRISCGILRRLGTGDSGENRGEGNLGTYWEVENCLFAIVVVVVVV